MSADWNSFLALAKTLAREQDEGSLRSAISRAYYAAFNIACEYVELDMRIAVPKVGDKHMFVWASLRQGPKSVPDAARRGESFRRKRNRADYDRQYGSNLKTEAEWACREADWVIATLNR